MSPPFKDADKPTKWRIAQRAGKLREAQDQRRSRMRNDPAAAKR